MKEFILNIKEEYQSYSKEKKQFFAIAFTALIAITAANFLYGAGEICGRFLYNITH